MKLIALALVTLFGLSIGTFAWAADWMELSKTVEGGSSYVDLDSLLVNKQGNIEVWHKVVFTNEQLFGEPLAYGLGLVAVDCVEKKVSEPIQLTLYGIKRQVLFTKKFDEAQYLRVVPESVNDRMQKFVCGYWKAKQALPETNSTIYKGQHGTYAF